MLSLELRVSALKNKMALDAWQQSLNDLPNPVILSQKVASTDQNYQWVYVNDAFKSLLGYGLDEVASQQSFFEMTLPDEKYRLFMAHELSQKRQRAHLNERTVIHLNIKLLCKDQVERWFQINFSDGQEATQGYRVISFMQTAEPHEVVMDLQETAMALMSTKLELTQQFELLKNIIENVPVRVFWKNLDGRYQGANSLFLQDANIPTQAELIGKTDHEMAWGKDFGQCYFDADLAIIQSGIAQVRQEDITDNGVKTQAWMTSRVPLFDSQAQVIGMLGTYEDITAQRDMEQALKTQALKMEYQAHHDYLTKLPNRVLFQDRLEHAIHKAKREKTLFAVMFVDLDNFKKINDSLGHQFGDLVLQHLTDRLRQNIREEDTLSRLGGDEFTVIQEDISGPTDAAILAQKLIDMTRVPLVIQGHTFYLSNSIGISIYPQDGLSCELLLKCADAAMYRAKEEGRNNFQFYHQEMTLFAFEQMSMQNCLRAAVDAKGFEVYFQPKFNAKTGGIIGLEALVRWFHISRGAVPPDSFIPLAEEIGVIVELDRWVMRTAMMQVAAWYEQGLNPGRLSLNLSVKHLKQTDFINFLQDILQEICFLPEWLELEVTESGLMQNISAMSEKLQLIKAMGIEISIDDFGTGYSSLSYLKRLPVSKLKIDRSFINGLPEDLEDAVIAKTIISMAENLGLSVIAEGVETEAQRDFLVLNRCDYIQGYLTSPAISAKDMQGLLVS